MVLIKKPTRKPVLATTPHLFELSGIVLGDARC